MNAVQRIVAPGSLLYEYVVDEKRYILVGVIDNTACDSVDPETGISEDEKQESDFYLYGTVKTPARFIREG